MVYIIAIDEYLKTKLIFANKKNQKNAEMYEKVCTLLKKRTAERHEVFLFSAAQIRTKFKKIVAECEKAAMLMKTASCIKRFQEERGHGPWFNQLFALMKRDSCQPEQAIEPSAMVAAESTVDSPKASSSSQSSDLFVPIPPRKVKTQKEQQLNQYGQRNV